MENKGTIKEFEKRYPRYIVSLIIFVAAFLICILIDKSSNLNLLVNIPISTLLFYYDVKLFLIKKSYIKDYGGKKYPNPYSIYSRPIEISYNNELERTYFNRNDVMTTMMLLLTALLILKTLAYIAMILV